MSRRASTPSQNNLSSLPDCAPDAGTPAGADCFRKRSGIILLILALWGGISAGFMICHAGFRREKLLAESSRIAWREGRIPPIRGSILSSDSKVILHTVLTHDLMMRESPRMLKILPVLKGKIRIVPEKVPNGMLLKRGIHPDEISAIRKELTRNPELFIRPVMKRVCTLESLSSRAGTLAPARPGGFELYGVDGWEKEFDAKLRGRAGIFRVMLDRRGCWVPGTLEVIRAPEHGENVRLKWSWKELSGK